MGNKSDIHALVPKIGVPAIAVISGSFLSGAMTSLSAFGIPVFLDTNHDADFMLQQWARLYHYGHIYMPALCVVTCSLYGYSAISKRAANRRQWHQYALAALTTIAMVPFTWIVMVPTNDTLFQLEASGSITEMSLARSLVMKWAWLHVVRSLFPLLGAFLGFSTLLQELRA